MPYFVERTKSVGTQWLRAMKEDPGWSDVVTVRIILQYFRPLKRPLIEMRNGAAMLGSDILGMEVSLDEGLWDHELMDPNTLVALPYDVFFFLPYSVHKQQVCSSQLVRGHKVDTPA